MTNVIQTLTDGWIKNPDHAYCELWLRAFYLLNGLASNPDDEFVDEVDRKFIKDFIDTEMRDAMKMSLDMRPDDERVLATLRRIPYEEGES